jgi:Archaeal phage integrase
MDSEQVHQQKDQQDNNKIGYKRYGWKNVAIKVKENDLIALNRQLDRLGYETLGELVKDLIFGKITRMTEDKQIDAMIKTNLQATGQITGQSGNYYDFYKTVDINDLSREYNKRYHPKTTLCLVNYFKRYADIFFGPEPDTELFKLKPHKRGWILQAMKRFGDYYFWKYNTREVQELVRKIIERYVLNKDLDYKDRIYLVNPNYLQTKINTLLAIPGEIGFTIKIGLFTGLREEELYYIHDKGICNNELGCKCSNLHPIKIDNTNITIIGINWIRGNKKAFVTILPTDLWEQFRKLPKFDRHDIVAAHSITKRDADILYMGIRKVHYNVMRFKDTMTSDEADALAGRAKSVSAQHYVLHDLKSFADKYVKAWDNLGVKIQ